MRQPGGAVARATATVKPVIIATLRYLTDDLTAVDAGLDEHLAWVDRLYADGIAVLSGPLVPRTGGVILALGARTAVEARLADDPFVRQGLAAYDVAEVAPRRVAPGLESLTA